MGKKDEGGGRVVVCCRVRPQNKIEDAHGGLLCVGSTDTSVKVESPEGEFDFQFDRVFGTESNQEEVFEFGAAPIVAGTPAAYCKPFPRYEVSPSPRSCRCACGLQRHDLRLRPNRRRQESYHGGEHVDSRQIARTRSNNSASSGISGS
jgi:hypothetical protein